MSRTAIALLALLTACNPSSAVPVKMMAIVPSSSGTYATAQVNLTTLKSIANMKGTAATLIGGAQVQILADNDPLLTGASSPEQLENVLTPNRGGDVKVNLIQKGDVFWPADFHSWGIVTTYFNFEEAYKYFVAVYDGNPTTELESPRVMYFAGFRNVGQDVDSVDNALFFSPVRAFLILPYQKLQKVPLSLNLGIIGHEFAHLVFNKKAFGGASIAPQLNSWTLTPFNVLKSMDEGFADFHGYGVTAVAPGPGPRPNFLAASFDDAATAARDISIDTHCLTENLRNALSSQQPNDFLNGGSHYLYGTLIAASLYQASEKTGKREILQKALVVAYSGTPASTGKPAIPGFKDILTLNLSTPQAFTPELMVNTIVANVTDPELTKQLCNEFVDRLQLACTTFPCAAMPACPNTAGSFTRKCKVLPPPP